MWWPLRPESTPIPRDPELVKFTSCLNNLDLSSLRSLDDREQGKLSDSFLNNLDQSSLQPLEVLKHSALLIGPEWFWKNHWTLIQMMTTWTRVHFGPSRSWNTPYQLTSRMILKKSLDSHLCDDHLDQSSLRSLETLNQKNLSDSVLKNLDQSSLRPFKVLKHSALMKVLNNFVKITGLWSMWWSPVPEFTSIPRDFEPVKLPDPLLNNWTRVHFSSSRPSNTLH